MMVQFEEEKELRSRCEEPVYCEDEATHTFQFGGMEFLLCCGATETVLQRILDGESIAQVMFELVRTVTLT